MLFMNEHEIDEAVARCAEHDVLGPATRTLSNLRDVVNGNSDGWAYWTKPLRSAEKLMQLIQGDRSSVHGFFDPYGDREDATRAKLKAAYTPIKGFRTRTGLDFKIVEPDDTTDGN